ncbi:glutamate--tRNA ligase [Candidatus Mycoplasma haematobovis]|uniref:Glutamate--tRNA ligase n=1 Tax=Candidatus Mycoplasma haematobovis TaxID=432608 RepID=A0A1A9QCK8_9MOLU|nr:glutamate--tRNA ligase [Candidatus Mycoplasma haematobovis]OAL10183.1 glutamate--tRNA ligase [Candidatus Mycoplasma haematobovis]
MEKKTQVCTRYAPSPTGALHIGGARTALFNYVYAKKHKGKFIMRIEDTDQERNIGDGHIGLEEDLKFLNIFPDESFSIPGPRGPYLQSQKLDRYRKIANALLKEGKAYRCFCTEKELTEARERAISNNSTPIYSKKCRNLSEKEIEEKLKANIPHTIRLKVNILKQYQWKDLVRGEITVPEHSMSDYIIMRSNGNPTYNFAVVIDDYDMGISHVLRGEEHISNTPYQLATYHALGWEEHLPEFGHLSIIVDIDRKKLSKRSGNELHFISGLSKKGYPPEAIFNFLALLGWSNGEEEIFSSDEIIKDFKLESLSLAPAYYDIDKLNWMSHKYFQSMSAPYYLNFVNNYFTVDLGDFNDKKEMFALANKKIIYCASQLNEMAKEFYESKELDVTQIGFLKKHKNILNLALDHFPLSSDKWDLTTIRNYLKQLIHISELEGKSFYKPLRLAFSFREEGFELANVMECLGRDVLLNNLNKVMALLNE